MKKVGIYAGSFNPFHKGHANILTQACDLFDEVIIAVGENTSKNNERVDPVLGNAINGVKVKHYSGLLSDFLGEMQKAYPDSRIFLVRGLRDEHDLPYETKLIQFVKEMYPLLKVVFLKCARKYDHISSSDLRAIKKLSEEEYKKYLVI